MKLEVLDDAQEDVVNAALRYESLRDGLGDRFINEVLRSYARLEDDRPFSVVPFRRHRKRVIRRLFLRRFPYRVFFVDEPELRIVVGVPHDRQRAYWLSRVPPR